MAFSHGKDTKVYIAGRDLSTYFRSSSISVEVDTAETSTFGTSAKTYVSGMTDATLSLEGVFDGATGAVDAVLAATLGVNNSVFTIWPQGDSNVGDVGYGFAANSSSYEISTDIGDMAAISVEAQSSVAAERVLNLHPPAARTADGNGTAIDNAIASTANGGSAYLHVTAYSGFTSVSFIVEDSADNVSFATIGTFTLVTAVNASQRIAIAGTIRRYVRVRWDVTGAGSVTFNVGFCRK